MDTIYSDTQNNTYTKMNLNTVKWAQWHKTQPTELLCLFICECIALCTIVPHNIAQNTTTTTTTVLRPFVRDYPGEPVPEETLTHPPSWSSSDLYQLPPSTTIHSILVQITCLAVFLHNLFPCPLWSTSWSGALHLIFHTFLHTISVIFLQHMPISSQPVLL